MKLRTNEQANGRNDKLTISHLEKRNVNSKGPKHKLASVSVRDLYSEIERRKAVIQKLMRRYERLLEQTDRLKEQIEAHGSFAAVGDSSRRRRARNNMSLLEVMEEVLAGKELSVDQVTKAILQKGYKSTSRQFRAIVNRALITNPKFKRVSRGIYRG